MPLFIVKETNKTNAILHLEVWRAPNLKTLSVHLRDLPAWSPYRERTIECIETSRYDGTLAKLYELTQLP